MIYGKIQLLNVWGRKKNWSRYTMLPSGEKSWLKQVEHDFTLYDIPPRCGFKFFNPEKCLKNSEKKLLEIIHVKLQTKLPKKRLIFFPTAEVCIFMYFFASFAFQVWFVWCSPL